jgi:indole-3-glycerol phosphate synthase
MSDILDKICAEKRRHIAERQIAVPQEEIEKRALSGPTPRGFADRLAARAARQRYGLRPACPC